MLFEIVALGGAVGIAVAVFAIIVSLADKPVKALITALVYSYVLYFLYFTILNRIARKKRLK